MIVNDFNLVWTLLRPTETNPIAFVDANAVLPKPVSKQWFKSVSRRNAQILEDNG